MTDYLETQISDSEFLCTDLKPGEMVWVTSEQFKAECWAYAHSLSYHPPMEAYGQKFGASLVVHVGLELDDDNPSYREAKAHLLYDGCDAEPELDDILPVAAIRHAAQPGRDGWIEDRPVRVWKRALTSSERAARARRRGYNRPVLAELDTWLRRPGLHKAGRP